MSNEVPSYVKEWMFKVGMPIEMLERILEVFEFGASKHGKGTWLHPNNPSLEDSSNFKSICGHTARGTFKGARDEDTGLYEEWHAATRCIMKATRKERGIDK